MILSRMGGLELWMSSSQVTDLLYILSNGGRASESAAARDAIRGLRKIVHGCAPGKAQVDAALLSPWSDFEDAFLFEAAKMMGASAIVTRDTKGFRDSPLPHFGPGVFIDWLKENHGISYETVS